MKIVSALLVVILLKTVVFANHPSFDCSNVKKESSEGIICRSDRLMHLDRELAAVYKEAVRKSFASDMLKAEQRGWIKGRNDCWKADNEERCISDAYKTRIEELKKRYHLSTKQHKVPQNKVRFRQGTETVGDHFPCRGNE
ncbi:MAG: hypothetical protein DSZ10_02865 [Sulfurovum sp.]|nr:MAG: hypothetical protein DSZ10_02865 [Sulfurovum sp.]